MGKNPQKQAQESESKTLFIQWEILFLASTESFQIGWGSFKEKPRSIVISCEKCFDQGPDQMTAAFRQQLSCWEKLHQAVTGRRDTGGIQLVHWAQTSHPEEDAGSPARNHCAEGRAGRTALQGMAGCSSQHRLASEIRKRFDLSRFVDALT